MSKPPVIKQSMMTQELQEYAIQCAITAMQEKNTEEGKVRFLAFIPWIKRASNIFL